MPAGTSFTNAIDIANRAIQHIGSDLVDPILGFTELSRAAQHISNAYPKLRQAELRRNVWTFAVREQALRALDTNTLFLSPSLWSSFTTYFVGSIVSDQTGYLWISKIRDNLGFQPESSSGAWDPYFGPLTVSPYDSSQTYFTGELVYTFAGDGTFNTYLSLANGNAVHPALPNEWSISTVYFRNQVVRAFPAWAGGTTYTQGQTVSSGGLIYSSLTNGNLNHTPASSPTFWVQVPTLILQSQAVPVTTMVVPPSSSPVKEWSQSTTYALGNFVMFNGIEYLSIQNNNTGNFPNAAASTFWKPLTLGVFYMSRIDLNLANDPITTTVAEWSSATTYGAAATVTGSDGVIYSSIAGGNLNHDPTFSPTFWTNTGVLSPWDVTFTLGGGNPSWMQVGGASFPGGTSLTTINIQYPLNSGPVSQASTRNAYRLPAGFLRQAPSDPKAGSTSALGAPSGLDYNDWRFDGKYIVTQDVPPIILRFVADFTNVVEMDPMFCEGLAARIGLEVCQPLTQSSEKTGLIAKEYEKFMGEARLINGIEQGATEPAEDDWITCRA
jgi:hypothetical protein